MKLLHLFKSKRKESAESSKVQVSIKFTDEEAEVIRKNREAFLSLTPNGQLWMRPEAANSLDALALVDHVAEMMRIVDDRGVQEDLRLAVLDKAIKTQAKVCALHDLPYYLFLWADLCDVKGTTAEAKRLYSIFLRAQTEFKPDETDSVVLSYLKTKNWFDVEDAIKQAQSMVSEK